MSKTATMRGDGTVDLRAKKIWDKIEEHLRGRAFPELVQGEDVLVALWEGDDKIGSIYVPDDHKDENIYQGKAGLVIALGHQAFTEDETHHWGERVPRVGDWVVFRVADGWPVVLGGRQGQHCRVLKEQSIRMVVDSPDVVY
jgi:co-chaperonin GroES (HSP10)